MILLEYFYLLFSYFLFLQSILHCKGTWRETICLFGVYENTIKARRHFLVSSRISYCLNTVAVQEVNSFFNIEQSKTSAHFPLCAYATLKVPCETSGYWLRYWATFLQGGFCFICMPCTVLKTCYSTIIPLLSRGKMPSNAPECIVQDLKN